MAKDAGLITPEAKLFPSRKGIGFFDVERFDRKATTRIHMHTADHREPCLDYESIMKATFYLTEDIQQCEIQFRDAVFNVVTHNRDDHSKNCSLLMDADGVWTVSPAYDLTFSWGPAREHSTMIMAKEKKPRKEHLLKLASVGNIGKERGP